MYYFWQISFLGLNYSWYAPVNIIVSCIESSHDPGVAVNQRQMYLSGCVLISPIMFRNLLWGISRNGNTWFIQWLFIITLIKSLTFHFLWVLWHESCRPFENIPLVFSPECLAALTKLEVLMLFRPGFGEVKPHLEKLSWFWSSMRGKWNVGFKFVQGRGLQWTFWRVRLRALSPKLSLKSEPLKS